MTKVERKRRQARDRKRAERCRKAAHAAAAQHALEVKAAIKAAQAEAEEADRQRIALAVAALKRRCMVCNLPGASFEFGGVTYCAEHGKAAAEPRQPTPSPTYEPPAELPLPQRPDPLLFQPSARDPYRPSWWQDVDPNPKPIRLSVHPRARRSAPIQGEGQHTVRVAYDEGISYSEADGHRDLAAERAQQAEDAARRQGDHTAWQY